MIRKEELVEIGKFQKTHALKGELNALLDVDVDYAEDDFPLIIEIDGIFVPFYVESIRTKGSESFLVRLKGVESQEEAKEFVNKTIFGLRKDVEEYFGGDYLELPTDFIGYKVKDQDLGEIGVVTGVDDSTVNVLLLVETKDHRTVFIPIAEELITNIDDESKVIETDLPEGLIDLN